MSCLWIGLNVDELLKEHVLNHGGQFLSASVSQNNLFRGLTENGLHLDSINANQVAAYPKYRELKIRKYRWVDNKTATKHISVGYINLKYINILAKKRAMVREAKKWAEGNVKCDNAPIVFVYQMHSPFLAAAAVIKKIIPKTRIVLIVPDLPQYMDLRMSRVKRMLKKIDWHVIARYLKVVDRYVLYTKHMAEFLGLRDGTWMVMEGSVNSDVYIDRKPLARQKAIMYAGACQLDFGFQLLLDAFHRIEDKDCELWITGSGNAVDLIMERAKVDHRIRYFGYLPSRDDLLLKEMEATALINMRLPTEPASAYCFPSKILEYMLSGNPVLSFKMPGIPDEYFEYIISIGEQTEHCIADNICQVLAMTGEELNAIGIKEREFVLSNKSIKKQAERIMQFIGLSTKTE